jgi:hypothetical protein
MPISQMNSRFITTGNEEVGGDFKWPPVNCTHTMRVKEMVDKKTSKGEGCIVQTSEFISFETALTVRTYYLEKEKWSIVRLDNMFRNLGYTSRVDINGVEFKATIVEQDYTSQNGEAKKRLKIKWTDLWMKPAEYQQKYGTPQAGQQTDQEQNLLPSGVPQEPSSSEGLVEDEIPF